MLTKKKNRRLHTVVWLTIVFLFILASAPVMAESSSSRSINFITQQSPDKSEKDARLKLAEIIQQPAIMKQGFRDETDTVSKAALARYSSAEVTLFDASTELISDINHDGYYHRFSVTIDADTIYTTAYIYAKLYLSYEGGPWHLYTTSETFHIHGDSDTDTFTVETELTDGFDPGYYDVRIELYDGDYHNRILSYGPYDDASLSALPLEDSYFDDYIIDVVPIQTEVLISADAHAHGAMSWGLLMIPALVLMRRRTLPAVTNGGAGTAKN